MARRKKADCYQVVLEKDASRQDWLDARIAGIGGSEIGAILGRSRFATPLDIYMAKVMGEQTEPSDAMEVGTLLEPSILNVAIHELNKDSEGTWRLDPDTPALVVSLEHPVALYSPDGIAIAKNGRRALLETKATNLHMDVIPDSYHDQVRWGLGVLGLDVGYLVAVNGTRVYKHRIEADPEWFEKAVQYATEWYTDHVGGQTAPDPDPVRDQTLIASMRTPEDSLRHEAADPAVVASIRDLKQQIAQMQQQVDEMIANVKAEMGNATVLTVGDEPVATYKQSSRTALDTKRLKAEQPDLYLAYSRTSPVHTFRLLG